MSKQVAPHATNSALPHIKNNLNNTNLFRRTYPNSTQRKPALDRNPARMLMSTPLTAIVEEELFGTEELLANKHLSKGESAVKLLEEWQYADYVIKPKGINH